MLAIERFGGIRPRAPWHSLEKVEATVAHNVKLRNGKIQAWRERRPVGLAVDEAKTLYYDGCCLLSWPTCVEVADYVTDYGRLYITGREERPEVLILNDCVPTYYWLGVPRPTTAPTAVADNGACEGRTAQVRSYVYTYVNVFGEESAPSPPSADLSVCDGERVVISGLVEPPDPKWGVTEIWLYRTATGYRQPDAKTQEPLTDYLKVAEFSCDTTSYEDTTKDRYLGPILTTREVRVPPADMRNIAYLRGTGVLAGTTTNGVHFCSPYMPYNWPAEYDLTLPYNIVNAVAIGSDYYVSTSSYPYVITGDGACEARKCRNVTDADHPVPDISCGYAHSAIATPFGMVYSSKYGLILVSQRAEFTVLTRKWFSVDDWAKIRPDTVRMGYSGGYLFVVTDVVSLLFAIDIDKYGDVERTEMTTISDRPVDLFETDNAELLMLDDDRLVHQWNAGNTLRDYQWESRELFLDGQFSPTACRIRTDGTWFSLLCPWEDTRYERYVPGEKPFRLGRLGRHLKYRIRFTGTGDVEYVRIAPSIQALERQE